MRTEPSSSRGKLWARRVGWLVVFWILGVAAVGAAALVLKLFMRAAGLTT